MSADKKSHDTVLLHMVCGKIASGKSTLTAKLARYFVAPDSAERLHIVRYDESGAAI